MRKEGKKKKHHPCILWRQGMEKTHNSWCLRALGKAGDSSQQPPRSPSCAGWPFSDTKTSERTVMFTLGMSPNAG